MSGMYDKCTIQLHVTGHKGMVLVVANKEKHATRVFSASAGPKPREFAGIDAREVVNRLAQAWSLLGVYVERELVHFCGNIPSWGHSGYGIALILRAMDYGPGKERDEKWRKRWYIEADRTLGDLARDWDFLGSVVVSYLERNAGMMIKPCELRSYTPTGQEYTTEYVRATKWGRKIVITSVLTRDV